MYKHLLTKGFFKNNPYKEIPAQRFAYSFMLYKDFEELASELIINELNGKNENTDAKDE